MLRRHLLVLALLLAAPVPGTFMPAAKAATALASELAQADRAFAVNDWQTGLNLALKVVQREPGNAEAWVRCGRGYGGLDQYAKARQCFDKALTLQPGMPAALTGRAKVHLVNQEAQAALADLNQAIHNDPGYANAYLMRAVLNTLYRTAAPAAVEADYNRALALDGQDLDNRIGRGSFYFLQGRYDAAENDFQAALAQKIDYPPARGSVLNYLGMIQYYRQNYDQALKLFEQVLALKTTMTADAYNNIGLVELARKQNPQALQSFKQAIAATPSANPWYNIGDLYAGQGDFEQAIAAYSQALAIKPRPSSYIQIVSLPQIYVHRGHAYQQLNQPAKALADFNTAVGLDPEHIEALGSRALAYADQQNFAKALADLDAILKLDKTNAKAFYFRGLIQQQTGQPQPALADLSQAIACDRDFLPAYLARVDLYFEAGQTDAARGDLEQILRLQPDNALAWYHLGRLQLQAGETGPGGRSLDKACELGQVEACQEREP